MSYSVDTGAVYRQTATFVDKIIRGRKPTDLPVELPTKFVLIINLKTANAGGHQPVGADYSLCPAEISYFATLNLTVVASVIQFALSPSRLRP
jgi:hypothetical protein